MIPGQMVIVRWGAYMRRFGTDIEFYNVKKQVGIILQSTHLLHDTEDGIYPTYLVLLSNDSQMYLTSTDMMDDIQ